MPTESRSDNYLVATGIFNLERALTDASVREHQWIMGVEQNREVTREEAKFNWISKGFYKWVKTELKRKYLDVRDYVINNRSSELDDPERLKFSSGELHHLLGYAA